MFLRSGLAAFAAVAALAVGAPVALASATTIRVGDPVITGPSCPDGYDGPTNLATGCPWWMMAYSVEYPGQGSRRCPPGWSPPSALPGVGAADGSAGPVIDGCGGVPTGAPNPIPS
jgi:hypothetical protein